MEQQINRLAELFSKFPGIGARQSQRFVYFLLSQPEEYVRDLLTAIQEARDLVKRCTLCQRFHAGEHAECTLCANPNRDTTHLLVVEKDVDVDNVERTGLHRGLYFVIGGTVPILEEEPHKKIRATALKKRVANIGKDLNEITLAFSANPEGEHTAQYVRDLLAPVAEKHGFRITTLGRGLSTGLELEYSDSETLKAALQNRRE